MAHLNPFQNKRNVEKSVNMLILDISPSGVSNYKYITLRSLLNLINEKSIDDEKSRGGNANQVHYRDLRRLNFHLNPHESKCLYFFLPY